jgi:hypothetical protein
MRRKEGRLARQRARERNISKAEGKSKEDWQGRG